MTRNFHSPDAEYCIVTDAAADLDADYLAAQSDLCVIPMSVVLGGREYIYGPGGDLENEQFYERLKAGTGVSTSQINIASYLRFFEPILALGKDILYLCFSSGLSGMYQNAAFAAEELRQHYPERKICCIDTLCAAPGEGFLVREAVQRKHNGWDLDSLADWVEENRNSVDHWFTVQDLEYLHRGGRVSAASAVLGTALQIKPLLSVDAEGKLQVVGKSRGMKRAMTDLLDQLTARWAHEKSGPVVIVHADRQEQADQLQQLVTQKFPEASVYQSAIGPVIGSHTGPGLLGLVFWGRERSKSNEQEGNH